jgi:hypothetical protein
VEASKKDDRIRAKPDPREQAILSKQPNFQAWVEEAWSSVNLKPCLLALIEKAGEKQKKELSFREKIWSFSPKRTKEITEKIGKDIWGDAAFQRSLKFLQKNLGGVVQEAVESRLEEAFKEQCAKVVCPLVPRKKGIVWSHRAFLSQAGVELRESQRWGMKGFLWDGGSVGAKVVATQIAKKGIPRILVRLPAWLFVRVGTKLLPGVGIMSIIHDVYLILTVQGSIPHIVKGYKEKLPHFEKLIKEQLVAEARRAYQETLLFHYRALKKQGTEL